MGFSGAGNAPICGSISNKDKIPLLIYYECRGAFLLTL
jgi:hypothetical protein